jgi:hypothetical protein
VALHGKTRWKTADAALMSGWIMGRKLNSSARRAVFVALIVNFVGSADAWAWWDTAWSHRRKLTFNNAGQPENLVDFPVLVVLNSSRIDYTRTQNAGQDLRFVDSNDATVLKHEIEKWDEAGTSYVWVKVPQIDASSSTDFIYVYYGNPSASAPPAADAEQVWDSGFKMVHHLEETSGAHVDSSSNNNDSVVIDVATQGSAAGQIDGADVFSAASTDHIDVANNATLNVGAGESMTVEAWMRTSTTGSPQHVASKEESPGAGWDLMVWSSNEARFTVYDDAVPASATVQAVVVTDNAWHYLVGRWNRVTSTAELFVDGVSAATTTNGSLGASSFSGPGPFVIGEEGDASRGFNFNGTIDEVRFSKVPRSSDWIKAQNLSMRDSFVSFGAEVAGCCGLTTTEVPGSTITVTSPNQFEMRFNLALGGGIDQFYDLAEDPSRTYDLAGAQTGEIQHTLFTDEVDFATTGWTGGTSGAPEMDLLEATATRVRVRQEAFYEKSWAPVVVAGLKGYGDYSIYAIGRLGIGWERRATQAIPSPGIQQLQTTVHYTDGVAPLNAWTGYSQTAVPDPSPFNGGAGAPTATDDFVLAQIEQAGARTDFLAILYQDWANSEELWFGVNLADQWEEVSWIDNGPAAPISVGSERWNFLTYFKPTNLASGADAAVTSRSADYRAPASLAVAIGSAWNDLSENTSTDNFNESEAAYTLTFDPTQASVGLQFDISGSVASPRYKPFFKIRQWRSMADPPSVRVEGVTLTNDVDFKADVKPVARAHFAQDLMWYSTLQNGPAVTAPNVGTGGSVIGADFPAGLGRFGEGARFDLDGEYVSLPSAGNFNPAEGAIEFWYRPFYDYGGGDPDPDEHGLFGYFIDANNFFYASHDPAGAAGPDEGLKFEVSFGGGANYAKVVLGAGAGFTEHWRANEWVHLRFVWKAHPVTPRLEIYINGKLATPSAASTGSYTTAAPTEANFYIGDRERNNVFTNRANGIIDEFRIYNSADAPQQLASGGLTSNSSEYLGSPSVNFPLAFSALDGFRRGEYFYVGADSKFRGLNVAPSTPGAGTVDLRWEYWNGTSWADLESGFGFTDQTNHLKGPGTIYWTSDPTGWSLYSVNGGPDLYYVRASLASGLYTTTPVEGLIKTDILLFQYCSDVTAAAQTFELGVPVPTAVQLVAFVARGEDGAVVLEWRTGSELKNLGFHLYRSTSVTGGPYERITSSLIPGLGSSAAGRSYSYRDTGLVNGVTYFYKLEDVETTGKTERHGPVSAVPSPARAGTAEGASERAGFPEAGLRYGDPSATSLRVVERTARGMVLELWTGGFSAEVQENGTVRLSIPGFSEEGEPGAPSVPVKRTWIEAERGRGVRLASVREQEILAVPGLPRPSAVGAAEIVASRRGTVRAGLRARPEGAAFRDRGLFPEQAVRVLSEGYQGEQKKVLLELSPLRWDRTTGQLVLARRLTVRLVFSGREVQHRESRSHDRISVLRRLVAREHGLYAVRFDQVMGERARAVPASSLRLSRLGEPVPFHLEPDNGAFGPGSVLYFVSDGERLNSYGREAVYELERSEGGERMETLSARPSGPAVRFSRQRITMEENRYYQAGLVEAEDVWLWDLLLGPATKSYPFELSALASTSEPSRLRLWLQGASDFAESPDHHLRVSVNGTPVGETWLEGKRPLRLEVEISAGILREGTNQLELENVGDTKARYSMVMLDRFELEYPSVPVGSGGVWEGGFDESGVAEISGPGAGSLALEVSGKPRWLTGAAATGAGLRFSVEAGRRYLVVDAGALLNPEVKNVAGSGLKSPRNRADYLVVGPQEFLEEAGPLLELRRFQGLLSRAVSIEQVYSEFGFGEARPEAVREFISYAYHHWRKPAPRYVLLLGDATYDFKDYLETGVRNQVPPLMVKTSYLWTASDPGYAAVNGDDLLPDLAIGRLPAASADEVRKMVKKILAYENSGGDSAGPAVLVADNSDAAGDFEADAEELAGSFLNSSSPRKIYLGRLGAEATRQAIVEAFDEGASLMSYLGHGGIHLWASENIFSTAEVPRLVPQADQPLVLTLNCLNGYYHFPYFNALSEELLKAESKGAIAAFSPSGLSLNEPAHVLHKALLSELLSRNHQRLGDAVVAAQVAYAGSGLFPELLRIYHLLGDPALALR